MTSSARLLFAAFLGLIAALPLRAETVTVFAAASLKTALDEVADAYRAADGDAVVMSFAGSSGLARQIQMGAPADLFISANPGWMDALEAEGLLAPDSRMDLLHNTLVLVAPADSPVALDLAPGTDLPGALNGGRLAMALADAVPAGIYGKAALQSLDLWESVRSHTAQTENVRAALRLVALGEAALGIVYATDAEAEPRVRVVARFDAASHPPIVYPVAILGEGDGPAARRLLAYLAGPEAAAIFRRHGFGLAGDAG